MSEIMQPEIYFAARTSVEQVEEGDQLAPKFDENGCVPCITIHAETREVLMFAFMNAESLGLTISSSLAHYWSRSRQKLWKKGETSGMLQHVHRMLIDDDQDCVIIEVTLTPPSSGGSESSCHVGYRSCFYREVLLEPAKGEQLRLQFIENNKSFDPNVVYENTPNPTKL
jgi:phosphoribosyl-AMP cyclohydrolase